MSTHFAKPFKLWRTLYAPTEYFESLDIAAATGATAFLPNAQRGGMKLDAQDADGSSQAPHVNQHEPDSGNTPVGHSTRSRLMRLSDVERECAPTSPLRSV